MQAVSSSTARWPSQPGRQRRGHHRGHLWQPAHQVRVLSDVEPRTKDVAREMYEIIEQPAVLAVEPPKE